MTDEWKGGFDKVSWLVCYAEQMMRFARMGQFESECWALNAWEASADDADPDETAEADMAYSAEDSQ